MAQRRREGVRRASFPFPILSAIPSAAAGRRARGGALIGGAALARPWAAAAPGAVDVLEDNDAAYAFDRDLYEYDEGADRYLLEALWREARAAEDEGALWQGASTGSSTRTSTGMGAREGTEVRISA